METFFDAYVTAALWSSMDESTPQGGEPMDSNYTKQDIESYTLEKMQDDCMRFILDNRDELGRAMDYKIGYDFPRAGHDFWLTRNGHGTGFWDRDLGEIGGNLTEGAQAMGEYNLYVGDDGKIYGD